MIRGAVILIRFFVVGIASSVTKVYRPCQCVVHRHKKHSNILKNVGMFFLISYILNLKFYDPIPNLEQRLSLLGIL